MSQSLESIKEEFPHEGSVKSEPKKFWPEKPPLEFIKSNTVLTNLQRGNIPTMTTIVEPEFVRNLYQKAGQGEIRESDLRNKDVVSYRDSKGKTLLHWAAAFGQTPTVTLLLKHGSDPNVKGIEKETPLHYCASYGHHDIIRLLIAHGAFVDSTDENNCTPLMFASLNNHPHAVNELLLQGASITKTNINGDNSYSLSVERKAISARLVLDKHLLSILRSNTT